MPAGRVVDRRRAAVADEDVKTCQGCGASVYKEHLDRGTAGYWAGELLCNVCLAEKGVAQQAVKAISLSKDEEQISTIELAGENEASGEIRSFASDSITAPAVHDDSKYNRPLLKGSGATRCRTFHAKLSDGAISYMNQQINEWCDGNADIQIKFCSSTIGLFEGKQHQEPNLILTVFY
jgi:hypothetical protein